MKKWRILKIILTLGASQFLVHLLRTTANFYVERKIQQIKRIREQALQPVVVMINFDMSIPLDEILDALFSLEQRKKWDKKILSVDTLNDRRVRMVRTQ